MVLAEEVVGRDAEPEERQPQHDVVTEADVVVAQGIADELLGPEW